MSPTAWSQRFDTPSDFLRAVQEELRDVPPPPPPGEPATAEFLQITRERAARLGVQKELVTDRTKGHARVLADLYGAILQSSSISEAVAAQTAVGLLDTPVPDAFVVRNNGMHAVLISGGMMTMLHKCSKLTVAAADPARVVSCNRCPATELTKEKLLGFKVEHLAHVREFGVPMGAMVQLREDAASVASLQLSLSELFIIAHELGHIINGDLDDGSAFSMAGQGGWIERFEENEDHAREYRADLTGLRICETVLPVVLPGVTLTTLILASIVLFDDLYLLAGGPSSSHPDPLTRAVHLVEKTLGDDAARLVESSYDDPSALFRLMETLRS